MKLEHLGQIEELARFHSPRFLTTSLYLDSDKGRMSKKEIALSLKNLLQRGRGLADETGLSREQKESLASDLEIMAAHAAGLLAGVCPPGLALFSCRGESFWKEFELGSSPRNRLVVDHNPYVKPLSAVLDESPRVCVFLVDRREARWFGVRSGEAVALDSLSSDVPGKIKPGGFEGTDSKRIERRIEAHLLEHLKKAAQSTFDLLKAQPFDALFLGCADEMRPEVESLLHPYVRNKLRGALRLKPGAGPDKVLEAATELEKSLRAEEENRLLARFSAELEKGGLAVSGLRDTLRSLNAGEALTLLVGRDTSSPGRLCPRCKMLYLEEENCQACLKPTLAVADIIDEAVELALDKKTGVRHISPPSRLDRYGKIGALLRYRSG
jgi:peptide subunit release factor 1 (eRF1)